MSVSVGHHLPMQYKGHWRVLNLFKKHSENSSGCNKTATGRFESAQ